jgi:hypothetical protein
MREPNDANGAKGGHKSGGTYAEDDFSLSAQRSTARTTPNSDLPSLEIVQDEPAAFSTQHREIPAVERIARVLAARRLSINGLGTSSSAGKQVDQIWQSFVDDAVGILHALREPDPAMLAAGDGATWTAMVRAALEEPHDRAPQPRNEGPSGIYQKPLG